jgi:hypothetical protein
VTADALAAEVKRSTDADNVMSSLITQTAEKIDLKVSKGDISSQISVETGQVTIGSNRLVIDSDNFKLNGSGEIVATGSLSSESLDPSWQNREVMLRTEISAGGLSFYVDGARTAFLESEKLFPGYDDILSLWINASGLRIRTNDGATVYDHCYHINNGFGNFFPEKNIFYNGIRSSDGDIVTNNGLEFANAEGLEDLGGGVRLYKSLYGSTDMYGLVVDGTYLCTTGDFWCDGEKYRVVETGNYGRVGLSAMESAAPLFSDIGSGTLDDTGVAYIYIDPVFAETIDTSHDYQVFVSAGDTSSVVKVEKYADYFTVRGTAGAAFDWILFARQKDYVTHRLESLPLVKQDDIKMDNSIFYNDNTAATQSKSYMDEFVDTYDEQAEAYLKNYELEVTNYGN